jgi:group II intron reverse transcriptase/maturase
MINVAEEMKHLHKLAKREPGKRFNHLWENLTAPEWLAQAWEQIRRNKGSQTAGVDNLSAVDVDLSLIHKLAEELKTRKYRPKPVRRVHIPKASSKTRPLGIPTVKDRIVQQALKMVLEPIFEADFLACSHGFRLDKSAHTALRDVAHAYCGTSWIIEGDIEKFYDSIPHGKLIGQLKRRIADEKILQLVWEFLDAGYLEDWQYHKTYSGTAQGGVLSPLLANIFLHQLDEFVIKEFAANQTQTSKQAGSRRNPEYRQLESRLTRLRKKLRANGAIERKPIIKEIIKLEKQRKRTPFYSKDKRHPCKVKYVRYADDFVTLIAGTKQETEAIKSRIKDELSAIGLKLSEEKTRVTHWSQAVQFLGYNIKGKQRVRGIGIRAVLSIPQERIRRIRIAIKRVSGYHHIPEADVIAQLSAMNRGWCNYYRYARAPQQDFCKLASYMWWSYAHYLARKQKSSIAKMIWREKKARRLGEVRKGDRKRETFHIKVGKKVLTLDIFPPKTQQIRAIANQQDWRVDLETIAPLNWQRGRSLATRLAALDRAQGRCERCKQKSVTSVHHRIPIKGRSFLARVMSDQSQRETAIALCEECHLEVHGGSFNPQRQKLSRNAGYIERCSSGVGSAVERPITEM